MIATTLGQCVEAEAALGRLAAQRMPCAAAYHVAKLTKAVGEELQHAQTQRQALVREHGSERPAATPEEHARYGATVLSIDPSAPGWSAFVAKAQELAAVPVSLPLEPFDLSRIADLQITPADLLQLGPLVTANGAGPV